MRSDVTQSNRSDSSPGKLVKRLPAWQRYGIIALVVLLLYTVIGFLILPEPLRSMAEERLAAESHRQVSLQHVELNPFDFSVRLRNFRLQGLEGETLLAFDYLYVNLSVRHLLVGSLVLEDLVLEKPRVNVALNSSGELNWQLLIEQLSGDQSEQLDAQEEQAEEDLFAVRVLDFVLDAGEVEFNDRSRPTPYQAILAPLTLRLQNFSTQPESDAPYAFNAILDHGSSLRWSGDVGVNPLRSRGEFHLDGVTGRGLWEYIQDEVAFEIYQGEFSLQAGYFFDGSGEQPLVQLFDGIYRLSDFRMGYKRASDNMISIPELTLSGIELDSVQRQLQIEQLVTREGQISSQFKRSGELDLLGLFSSAQELSDATEESSAAIEESVPAIDQTSSQDLPSSQQQPWNFQLNRFEIVDYQLDFSDQTVDNGPSWRAAPVRLSGGPVAFPQQQPVALELELDLDDGTHAKVAGEVQFSPQVTLDIAVRDVDLSRLQPYIDPHFQLQLQQGRARVEGELNWQGGSDPQLVFAGQFQVDDLLTQDKIEYQDFVKWQSLLIEGVAFDQTGNSLAIRKITTSEPYARVIIYPDLNLNVSRVLSPPSASVAQPKADPKVDDSEGSSVAATDTAVIAETESEPDADTPMSVRIDQVVVVDGQANFADLSLQPQFATGIQMLNGEISGLTSDPEGRAKVNLEGKVDRYAPVKLEGVINPFSAQAYTDLNLSFDNLELTTLTPYSGKFAGYTINKGKLSLGLHYFLENRQLKGENRMVLDQLTLGNRTDSPDATSLPVTLALALMKDSQGRIDIDLPVSGDLDNPEFSYGSLVVKALTNLITGIISSPFRALGSLLGEDAESFGAVGFAAASTELSSPVRERLQTLVEALSQRPAIKVELTGGSNSAFDWPVIARQQLESQLHSLAWQHLKAEGQSVPERAEDLLVPMELQTIVIQKHYREQMAIEPTVALPTDDEIKRLLVATMPPQAPVLRKLAQARAEEIRRYLLEELQFEPARLYLMEVDMEAKVESGQVSSRLSLTD